MTDQLSDPQHVQKFYIELQNRDDQQVLQHMRKRHARALTRDHGTLIGARQIARNLTIATACVKASLERLLAKRLVQRHEYTNGVFWTPVPAPQEPPARTRSTDHTTVGYYAMGLGTCTLHDELGKQIEIVYGDWHGMGGVIMPAWTRAYSVGPQGNCHNLGSVDAVRMLLEKLPPGDAHGFKAIKGSGFVRKVTTRTRIDTETVDI